MMMGPRPRPGNAIGTGRVLAAVFILSATVGCDFSPSVDQATNGTARFIFEPGQAQPQRIEHPILTIPAESASSGYYLFAAQGVAVLDNGNVVVANSGNRELIFFDEAGRYIRTTGGLGDGPAEFRFISSMSWLPGDTLEVIDSSRRRVVRLDSAGNFLRAVRFFEPSARPERVRRSYRVTRNVLWGVITDASQLFFGSTVIPVEGRRGVRPFSGPAIIARDEGADTIGVLTVGYFWEDPGLPGGLGPLPMSIGVQVQVRLGRIYLAEPDSFRVKVLDGNGVLQSIVGEDRHRQRIEDADIAAYRARREALGRSSMPDDVPIPENYSAYDELRISAEGDIWVRHHAPRTNGSRLWTVFSSGLDSIRLLNMPGNLNVAEVRGERVYGFVRDSLDVQSLVVYDVSRREP